MRFQRSKGRFSLLSISFTIYNRSLKLTREGAFFIILIIGIGFGAINTGINLLYLILSMCLSFIIVSGILSEITLKNLSVIRLIPKEIFAEQPFPVQMEIKNNKRWFPSYSIWLEEDIDSDLNIPKQYFYHIKTGESEKKNVLWILPQRGLFKTDGMRVSTSYPFSFFIKTALIKKTEERVVYPAIRNVDDVSNQLASKGEITSISKGEGSDIFGFRKFTHGDSSKRIHWKTSAKVNHLMIKEHFMGESRKVAIAYDNKINSEQLIIGTHQFFKKFDDGVTKTASLANYFIREGCQVKIITHNQNIPFGSGFTHLSKILFHLALLEPIKAKAAQPLPLQGLSTDVIRLSYSGEYL